MPSYTENLKLKKPTQVDFYNVADFNENFETIDQIVGQMAKDVQKLVVNNGGISVVPITLTASGWVGTSGSFIQTVDAENVVADETKQIIWPTPSKTSMALYENYQIKATDQGDKKITFMARCDDQPTSDVTVFIATMGVMM